MAPINPSAGSPTPYDQPAWNEAHDRLHRFLDAFALADHSQVSRLTLMIFSLAKKRHRENPSLHPTTLVMQQSQELLNEWLARDLHAHGKLPSQLFASGYIALFLSRMFEMAPDEFLVSPVSEKWRQSMHEVLLVTGPNLMISSMTPRHLDYGPMLKLARETWHRWSVREILVAVFFWTGIYFISYWWLTDSL